MNIRRTALLLIDMQNDFLHANGAFGRAGFDIQNRRAIIEHLLKVIHLLREQGGCVIATNFIMVADKDNKPIISKKLKRKRPFLTRGDFQQGRWGYQLIDELSPADYILPKIADSAFYMTHLEWLLQKLDIENIIFSGIWSRPDLNPTIRDAQQRGFNIITLSDACGTFDEGPIQLEGLNPKTCASFIDLLKSNQ
ncbi:MAG: cysteine hydrolase [Saprospiraceae bacterium]|nr:cysteine hydrolase [Saprospiraceae bacterium]